MVRRVQACQQNMVSLKGIWVTYGLTMRKQSASSGWKNSTASSLTSFASGYRVTRISSRYQADNRFNKTYKVYY